MGHATRQRVSEVIQELNYYPNRIARRLVSQNSHVIGMLVPSIDYAIFPIIILGVEKVMHENNYDVLVYNTEVAPERARKGLELLAENQVDGIIVFTVNHLSDSEFQKLLAHHHSSVLVNNVLAGSQAGVVRIDVAYGIELLVGHLLRGGKRRLALLTFPKSNYSAIERLRGYKDALRKFDMPIDENLIILCDDNQDVVFDTIQDLIRNEPSIDALICYNDLMASTALKACFDLGVSVPEQIAVTGFDDIPFADLFKCALTTVKIPWFEVGISVAEMLLAQIRGEETLSEIVYTPELVIRESTPPELS